MAFDYSKLDGLITEKFKTRSEFAKQIGLSERSLSLKMNGISFWKQPQIKKCCEVLGISDTEIPAYFFALRVQ